MVNGTHKNVLFIWIESAILIGANYVINLSMINRDNTRIFYHDKMWYYKIWYYMIKHGMIKYDIVSFLVLEHIPMYSKKYGVRNVFSKHHW